MNRNTPSTAALGLHWSINQSIKRRALVPISPIITKLLNCGQLMLLLCKSHIRVAAAVEVVTPRSLIVVDIG